MKKAQVALFLVLGVVLLAALIFFLMYTRFFGATDLEQEAKERYEADPTGAIRNMVESCMTTSIEKRIRELGENGGKLLPDIFTTYNGEDYTYWCVDQGDFGCVNRMITRHDMEVTLGRTLQEDVLACADFSGLRLAGYDVSWGNITGSVTIGPLRVDGVIGWPITLLRDDREMRQKDYSVSVESDFGEVYELALRVLYAELTELDFNKDEWMDEHSTAYSITKHRPYPDTLYTVEKYSDRTKTLVQFRFALQGKDTAQELSTRFVPAPLPACEMPDKTVFAQVPRDRCIQKGGLLHMAPPSTWRSTATFQTSSQSRQDCGMYEDGESWCEYQGPTGYGLDYVGSRHYLRSCHDGKIYLEECRDFREEICVQTGTQPYRAVCRPNRWQDCAFQTNQGSCEDTAVRDCYWADELTSNIHISYGKTYADQLCHPQVPPGFRHWTMGPTQQAICSMANEHRNCDGFNCPQNWVDTSAIYCWAQGDCGNYRNIRNVVTDAGFASEGGEGVPGPRDYIYLSEDAIDATYRLTLAVDVPSPTPYDAFFQNQRASPEMIALARSQYQATASGWGPCDVCKCFLGIPVPGCQFKKYFHSSNTCTVWQAPQAGDCGSCGSQIYPCTEYWCKSIGQSCQYSENETGGGVCTEGAPSAGPLRIESFNTTGNFSMDMQTVFFQGRAYYGYNISPRIEPHTTVQLDLELNRPARCFVESLPLGPWNPTIYYTSDAQKRIHNISLHTQPVQHLADAAENLGFSSIVEATVLDRVDQRIQEFMSLNPQHTAQAQEAISVWQSRLEPGLRAQVEALTEEVQGRAVDTVQGVTTLTLRCVDDYGNDIPDTVLQYILAEDRTAPIMLVYNGSYGGPGEFQIVLSEPAECRYGIQNLSWNSMNHSLECPFMGYGLFSSETSCYGSTDGFPPGYTEPVYFICRDQPGVWSNFSIRMNRTENFTLDAAFQPRYLKLIPPNIIFINRTTAGIDQLPAFQVNTTETILKFRFRQPRTCAIVGLPSGMTHVPRFSCGMYNGTYGCDVVVPARYGNITRYPIRCRLARDFNENTFTINI
mgnify:CR=1 FL=1